MLVTTSSTLSLTSQICSEFKKTDEVDGIKCYFKCELLTINKRRTVIDMYLLYDIFNERFNWLEFIAQVTFNNLPTAHSSHDDAICTSALK